MLWGRSSRAHRGGLPFILQDRGAFLLLAIVILILIRDRLEQEGERISRRDIPTSFRFSVSYGIDGEVFRPFMAGSSVLDLPSLRLGLSTNGPLALRDGPEKTEHARRLLGRIAVPSAEVAGADRVDRKRQRGYLFAASHRYQMLMICELDERR